MAAKKTIREEFVTAFACRALERIAFAALAVFMFLGLASCGSGAVGGNPPANACSGVPCTLTILPNTATIYSGQPASFALSGGTGNYIVSSSNPSILPVDSAARTATSITLIANPVPSDATVTISVRDTGSAPVASATVTVKPGTINNDVQITPSSTQSPNCPAGTLCSGGDALVSVTLSQAGVALTNRVVRFDAVSGDFRFITSTTGTPDVLSTTAFVNTDETGRASIRIRATADAPNQTAVLQATDVDSGAFRRVSFTIAQSTGSSPGFFATPTSYTFQGPNDRSCASALATPGLAASFFIFGGVPPYTITSPTSGLVVNRETVSSSGGSFNVSPTGVCLDNVPITIRDTTGHTTSVTVSNVLGTLTVPPMAVAPDVVTLTTCSSAATVSVAGGTGNYFAVAGSDSIVVGRGVGGSFQLARNPNGLRATSPVTLGISDGLTTQTVTVNLTGQALGICPPPAFNVDPRFVTLISCTGTAQVIVSGGSGVYTASATSSATKLTLTGNTLLIGRNPGPAQASQVNVSDGISPPIAVNVTDSAGTCP